MKLLSLVMKTGFLTLAFQDEIMFIASGGLDAIRISLWYEKENVEEHECKTSPEIIKALAELADGTPQVHPFQISNSTFQKIAIPVRV